MILTLTSLTGLFALFALLPPALAGRVAKGVVVIVTPKEDQTIVWPYDLDMTNKLVMQNPTSGNGSIPSLAYNGNADLTLFYFDDDPVGRKDRVDMAMIKGNAEGQAISSFKYVVVSMAALVSEQLYHGV